LRRVRQQGSTNKGIDSKETQLICGNAVVVGKNKDRKEDQNSRANERGGKEGCHLQRNWEEEGRRAFGGIESGRGVHQDKKAGNTDPATEGLPALWHFRMGNGRCQSKTNQETSKTCRQKGQNEGRRIAPVDGGKTDEN